MADTRHCTDLQRETVQNETNEIDDDDVYVNVNQYH